MSTIKAIADTKIGLVLAMTEYSAPPERIFNALNQAKEIEHWWGSDEVYHMRDWIADFRPGGTYTVNVVFADGSTRPASGRFLEINEPFKTVYTRRYDWDFPVLGRRETTITYRIEPFEDGTRLNIRHEGFEGCSDAAVNHAAGWERVLGWLDSYLGKLIL